MRGLQIFTALILVVQSSMGSLLQLRLPTIEELKRELKNDNRLIDPAEANDEHLLEETIQTEEKLNNELMAKLRNTTIRVIARSNRPFLIIQQEGNETVRLTGFVGDLWTILQEHLGFTTNVLIGNATKTLDWDVQLNPKELGVKRMRKYSYSFPITKIWYNLFAKGVPDNSLSMFYFEVLDKKLWAIIFAAMVLLSAFLWLTWKIRLTMRLSAMDAKDKRDTNFSTCLLSVLGCMTNQGSQFKAESLASIRIITLMCIVLGLILSTSFSALLISKLATFEGIKAIFVKLNVDTLLKTPEGRTVCVAKTSNAFRRLSESVVKRRSTLKINGPPCTPGDHDLIPAEDYCHTNAVVLETKFNAFHTINQNSVGDGSCPIFIYNKAHYKNYMILVAQKLFPYMKIINKYLLRIIESGIMERLNHQWKKEFEEKDDYRRPEKTVFVRFDHIRTIISLYGCAIVVVMILLAAEKVCHWIKAKQPYRVQF